MTNHDELRKLAEAAKQPTPWVFDREDYTSDVVMGSYGPIFKAIGDSPASQARCEYIAAANPATILALLDELKAKDLRIIEVQSKLIDRNTEFGMQQVELAQLRAELEQCNGLLRRASKHIQDWWSKETKDLPPAGGVILCEDIDAALNNQEKT